MREVDAIQSRIEQVIVFASGAGVTRIATLQGPGAQRVRRAGLPLSVIDDTVRAEVSGPAVVTALRTGVTLEPRHPAARSPSPNACRCPRSSRSRS